MKLILLVLLMASGVAYAGESTTVQHPIKTDQYVYGIASGGATRFDGENSLTGAIGIGALLAEDADLRLSGELAVHHHGQFHTALSDCQPLPVAMINASGKRDDNEEHKPPHSAPTPPQTHGHGSVCDSSLAAEDVVGLVIEMKLNWTGGSSTVQPFATLGASTGDAKGMVGGLGLQKGPYRLHFRRFKDFSSIMFAAEFR